MNEKEKARLLELYRPLRVADVSDGMDWCMRPGIGLVDRAIRPVFRPIRAYGIAITARYVSTNRRIPDMTPEEYSLFVGDWYANVCPYPFGELVEPGHMICIDASGTDVGLLGSNNVLEYIRRGASGVVTDGGCRDTDEIIKQGCPVFARHVSRTMVQGRLEFADMMKPVDIGGVMVRPGDMVVADGDGVIVVPAEAAEEVAVYARKELESDKLSRRKLYDSLGMKPDDTV